MQNKTENKKIKTKAPPLDLAQLGQPQAQPASTIPPPPAERPSSTPAHLSHSPSPSLFPRPGSEQGPVPAAPPRRRRGRIRTPAPPASSGPSPTRPRSPLGLCASLPPDPRRSFLPHARRGRRRSPSFTRPPCPPRRPTLSPRTAVARCFVWCSPLETGAPTTSTPSSSSTSVAGDPFLPRRRSATTNPSRAYVSAAR